MPKYLQLTRPAQNVWQIALDSPPDNRIVPGLLEELHEALNRVEAEWRKAGGAVLDPRKRAEYAGKGAGALVFTKMYDPVMWRLLTFPLLTVAAINGHVFAGGMILALCCDYRIMTSGIGFMCMSELTFGAPLPNSFSSMLVSRIPHPQHLRDTLLARRWTQKELINIGLIDEVVEQQQVISRAVEYGAKEGIKVASGSWGLIKVGTVMTVI
ncbi:uncharacterized protein L203_105421 [Cryptococcus depauperatus CBS 7841]|uniref:Enoyl-CoA hydratase/isomerase n=1 Tax=Cryptococcus depauperatus CBS 7841 TaxID=1295531 RepID=A0AAJ8JXD9_9TREE